MQTIPQLLESGACIVRGWLLALSKKVGASRLEALARKKVEGRQGGDSERWRSQEQNDVETPAQAQHFPRAPLNRGSW